MTTRAAEVLVEIPGAVPEGSGRKPPEHGSGASNVTATRDPSWTKAERGLMEDVVSRPNMMAALECVFRAKLSTDSDANLPLIPIQTCQSFRRKVSTRSDPNFPV
ncbi:hypothetical protein JCM30471_14210 [Desulfuromonas carbonis]